MLDNWRITQSGKESYGITEGLEGQGFAFVRCLNDETKLLAELNKFALTFSFNPLLATIGFKVRFM